MHGILLLSGLIRLLSRMLQYGSFAMDQKDVPVPGQDMISHTPGQHYHRPEQLQGLNRDAGIREEQEVWCSLPSHTPHPWSWS